MEKHFLKLFIIAATFVICTSANAMTGVEFMAYSSPIDQKVILEPYILSYVSEGFKNVPNWAELSSAINAAIRKNGWGNQDLRDIAFEAAKSKGMTK